MPERDGSKSGKEERRQRWQSFHTLLVALFMLLIDITIVAVAVPVIQRDLHAKYGEVELVLSLYQVGFAALLITGGRLGDIHGRRKILNFGMAGFLAASAAAGMAPGIGFLVVMRLIQGCFAALMYPQVYAYTQDLFPAEERAAAFSTLGAMVGMGVVTGPLLGGFLLQWNLAGLRWRPIFLINLLIGAWYFTAGTKRIQESKPPHPPKLDTGGAGLAALWLVLLVWPITVGSQDHWPRFDVILLILFVPAFAGFWWYEARMNRRKGADPLVKFSMLRDRAFVTGLTTDLFCFLGLPGFLLVFFVVLQMGLGFTALQAGLTSLPYALGDLAGALLSERWVRQWGKRVLYLGTGMVAAGMAAISYTVHRVGPGVSGWDLIPALALTGLGWGTTIAPLINIILAAVKGPEAGASSGVLTTVQRVGGGVGVGLAGWILFALAGRQAPSAARAQTVAITSGLRAAGAGAARAEATVKSFQHCFVQRAASANPVRPTRECVPYLPELERSGAMGAGARLGATGGTPDAATMPEGWTRVLREATRRAEAEDFSRAFTFALWYQVLMFLIALGAATRMSPPDPKKIGQG